MKWIKQSFIFAFRNPKESLILIIVGLLSLFISSKLAIIGAVLTSVILAFIQAAVYNHLLKRPFFQIKNKSSLLLLAMLSIPTNIIMGSVVGLIQGSDNISLSLPMVVVFAIFSALSYIVIGHVVGFIVLQEMHFEKSLNAALAGFKKNRMNIFILSCLSAVLLMLSALPLGLGLIVVLPIQIYLNGFSFLDLYEFKKNEIDV